MKNTIDSSLPGTGTGPTLEETKGVVFEISYQLLGSAGTDGVFTNLNPAWERALGFSRAELMSRPFIEFVHPADRDATLEELSRLASDSAIVVGFENRYATKDGG